MLIRVEHATGYAYSEPLVTSTQYLRMTPVSGRTQAVESWKLTCPGAVTTPWQDQYGNLCHTLTVAQPVSDLEIKVCGLVRTRDTSGVVGMAPSELPSAIYLRETPYTVATTSIQDFAARFQPKLARDPIEVLHEIMMAIADAVEYRRGETHVHTTGAEALEQGSGVCQDHAHVFIAAARFLGIPARYVSGYLWTGENQQAYEASHAWAEAFVRDFGWIGFDPSNRICPHVNHIRTGVGLDYWAAAPVRGVRRGDAPEHLTVEVQVRQSGGQQ